MRIKDSGMGISKENINKLFFVFRKIRTSLQGLTALYENAFYCRFPTWAFAVCWSRAFPKS
jgi:hypothetical protein